MSLDLKQYNLDLSSISIEVKEPKKALDIPEGQS